MDLFELFDRGGPLMWVILCASLVGAGFFVDRLLALRRRKILSLKTFASLRNHLEAGDVDRAAQLCREEQSMFARICEAGFRHRNQERSLIKEAMEETGEVEVGSLNAGVGVLSTVAAISPLLGLLGTVTGMIQVFRDVSDTANPDISVLAGGIWQALITTGAGLTIAIPFYIAYRYVENRIDVYRRELEEATLLVLDGMMASRAAPTTAAADANQPTT
jgi:biopolymer transport protein ExbB